MKPEDQVCSLELAKKLKEIGIQQEEALYYWTYKENQSIKFEPVLSTKKVSVKLLSELLETFKKKAKGLTFKTCAAFTVAELGEMLPEMAYTIRYSTGWSWHYIDNAPSKTSDDIHDEKDAKTEADARAKMLIYLIENKIVNLK